MTRIFAFVLLLLLPQAVFAGPQEAVAHKLVASATSQIGVTIRYDPEYRVIAFPGGDVPMDRGVCSDVIVRAYRSVGIDLQKLVNADMRKHFDAYPHLWKLDHADSNIDHRRVPNLVTFFTRHGAKLPVTQDVRDYHPGDIVTWRLPQGLAHIGMVSDVYVNGRPLMLHNIGEGTRRDDVLFAFTITGHYRYLPVDEAHSS